MSHHETTQNGSARIVDAEVVEDREAPVNAEVVDDRGAPMAAEAVEDREAPANAEVAEDRQAPVAAEETVDGVPMLAEVRAIQTHSPASLPAVQAAAVAATGFVAGAATLALVRRHTARKLARSRTPRRALDALPIVGSRSFLVDVHLLAKPGE